jgi:flagellar motor switch protein FliG
MGKVSIENKKMTSKQKAALLLLSLNVETATRIMKYLSQDEIESLTIEITNLKGISSEKVDPVIDEYHQLVRAQEYMIQGGIDYAQRLLEQSLGFTKATDVIEKVKLLTQVKGFAMLKKADSEQLANFLQKEHPQTVAFILSNLSADQTATVLTEFNEELRNDVSFRMATLGKVSPTLMAQMEGVLNNVAESEISQNMSVMGGAKLLASILNRCNTATAKMILEHIEEKETQLAGEIKRLMFLFDDLVYIEDRGIQRILREVDKNDLALSLKVADEKLKDKIFNNMSERAKELLKEELSYLGPVRLKEVEAAQTRIVEIVKQLEDQGEIVVAGRGGLEEVFV